MVNTLLFICNFWPSQFSSSSCRLNSIIMGFLTTEKCFGCLSLRLGGLILGWIPLLLCIREIILAIKFNHLQIAGACGLYKLKNYFSEKKIVNSRFLFDLKWSSFLFFNSGACSVTRVLDTRHCTCKQMKYYDWFTWEFFPIHFNFFPSSYPIGKTSMDVSDGNLLECCTLGRNHLLCNRFLLS